MVCQVCQVPTVFSELGDPTRLCHRQSTFKGERYHFCSDHCRAIFDYEPEKYVQAWIPPHQVLQGNCGEPGPDGLLNWYHMTPGVDNGDFKGSQDQVNFTRWKGLGTRDEMR